MLQMMKRRNVENFSKKDSTRWMVWEIKNEDNINVNLKE
jgi:hypothetical protein